MLDTWNNESVRAAWDPDTPGELKPFLVYTASKTEAEGKAWEWVRLNEPSFAFNSVLPFMNVSILSETPYMRYLLSLYMSCSAYLGRGNSQKVDGYSSVQFCTQILVVPQ